MDEAVAQLYHYDAPKPLPSPGWSFGPLGLVPRMEIPLRIYPRQEPGSTGKPDEEFLVYFSRGLEENPRIKAHLHNKVRYFIRNHGLRIL